MAKPSTAEPQIISEEIRSLWDIEKGHCYLNHGSFGPSPRPVREAKTAWQNKLDRQPMDFYVRRLENELNRAKASAARFLGTSPSNLVFVENATVAMNVVASSFPLAEGDEILINNHEYGAVRRIWEHIAKTKGAKVVDLHLDDSAFESSEILANRFASAISKRTKIVILSHITSATALIWPLDEIIERLREFDVAICIDGPHAPIHVPLSLDSLKVDFYCASCHKWLCGPLGTGFLYAHPRQQANIEPLVRSWGRLLPAMPELWDEQFLWSGTRDPSGYLALTAAIEFFEHYGAATFRQNAYVMAGYAEDQLREHLGTKPIASRCEGWYGTMAHVPLPPGDWSSLQEDLFQQFKIEVPIIFFDQRWFIRVSMHLYNTLAQVEYLIKSLHQLGVARK